MTGTWLPVEVRAKSQNLTDFANTVQLSAQDDPDKPYRDWLARFLVVRSCGFVEFGAREIAREHVVAKSGGSAKTFGLSWLERIRNPKPENLEELLGRFGADYRQQLSEYFDANDQLARRELHYLVDRRHRLAHGENESINFQKAMELKSLSVEVVSTIADILNPT